jgi:crotonobetaine/carnitine-CoA ligase
MDIRAMQSAFSNSPIEDLLPGAEGSIPVIFAARVHSTPQARFLTYAGRSWDYESAWHTIRRYAGFFEALRGGRDDYRVASYLTNRPEALWAWFGAHVAGCVYVPLNRSHKGELLRSLLARSGATVLVTEASALPDLALLGETPLRQILLSDNAEGNAACSAHQVIDLRETDTCAEFQGPVPRPCSLATIMFTSGTTGRSKAVRIPHNMFCRGAARIAHALRAGGGDTFHVWMPMFHIAAQLHQTLSMVVAGGSVALFQTFSRSQFWQQVRETQSTLFCGLPNVLNLLWTLPHTKDDSRSSLRAALSGGIPPELHQNFEKRFALNLIDSYGMTEIEPITLPDPTRTTPVSSCGIANPDFELAIVDTNDAPVPAGQVGEIVVRPTVPSVMMMGYEQDDAETVQRCRNLWWHTGDLGKKDPDGFYYVMGRTKQMIRRRGENISAWELETLIESHPGVQECAVLGVPSSLGEEDVKAVVITRPGVDIDASSIYEFCRERIAFFMVPRFIEFRTAFPRNDVGKIEKLKLVVNCSMTWDSESVRSRR